MDSNEDGAIEITVIINIIIILLLLFFIKQHLQKECMCSCARQAFSQRLKFGRQVSFFAIKLSEITWCVFFEFLLKLLSTVSSHDGIDFLPKVGNFLSLLIIHSWWSGDCENTKVIFIFIIKLYLLLLFLFIYIFVTGFCCQERGGK